MPDREKLLHDSHWLEANYIHGYAVLAGHVSMLIRGSGVLVLTWITAVLLGGFVSNLDATDFWCLACITLCQTAGIFDASINEKHKYLKKAAAGFVDVFGRPAAAQLPGSIVGRFRLAAVTITCGMVVLPLALLYVYGIFFSGAISAFRLYGWKVSMSMPYGPYGEANLGVAVATLYAFAVIQCWIFSVRVAVLLVVAGRTAFANRAFATGCDDSQVRSVLNNYLHETSRGCEKDVSFVEGRNLITHAVDMIGSNSPADCTRGVKTLYTAICIAEGQLMIKEEEEEDGREQRDIVRGQRMLMKHLIVSPGGQVVLQRLLETLNPRGAHDRETRNQAAKIVERLACSIRLEQFPLGIQHVSSLIGTLQEYSIAQPYVRDYLYDEFEQHWILEVVHTPPQLGLSSSSDGTQLEDDYKELLVHGLRILRRLAADQNNCRVMSDTPGLLTKIMAPVASDLLHNNTLQHGEWSDIVGESIQVMARMLLTAGADLQGETRAKLRHEISTCKQAIISALWRILNCDECKEELKVHAIHILTRLYMDTKQETDDFVPKKDSSSSSRDGYVRMLVDIFTRDDNSIREYAGEALSLLCSRGVLVHIQEVPSLLKVLLVQHDAKNETWKHQAAEILGHLCTHCTKGDDRYNAQLKKTMTDAMPKVIEQILILLGDETDTATLEFAKSGTGIESQGNNVQHQLGIGSSSSSHLRINEQDKKEKGNQETIPCGDEIPAGIISSIPSSDDPQKDNKKVNQETMPRVDGIPAGIISSTPSSDDPQNNNKKVNQKTIPRSRPVKPLLSSLLSLYGTVYDMFISELCPDLDPPFNASSFLNNLRKMVVKNYYRPTVENLVLVKAISKMLISMMKHRSSWLVKQKGLHSLIKALSNASIEMQDLDCSMVFRSATSSSEFTSNLEGCTLASLVRELDRAPTPKYIRGEPFLTEDELEDISSPCQELHSQYLQAPQSQEGINLSIEHHHFHHSEGALQITVDWPDLWNLYNLKVLDASLMRCWTLHLIEKCREERIEIGFLDPHLMSDQSIDPNPDKIKDYVANALVAQKDKLFTLFAYNSADYYHWITIAVIPSSGKVYYLDSMKKKHDWKKVAAFIDKAWSLARSKGLKSRNPKLHHYFDFNCYQQKNRVQCGYHACHNMLLIVKWILANKKGFPKALLDKCDVEMVRRQLIDFLVVKRKQEPQPDSAPPKESLETEKDQASQSDSTPPKENPEMEKEQAWQADSAPPSC